MSFVFRFNVSLNPHSSCIMLAHSKEMLLIGEMEKDNSANQEELPFKEPDVVSPIELNSGEAEQPQSLPEPVIAVAPEAGEIDVVSSQDEDSKETPPNVSQLFEYLKQGMESLRGLNLEGFRHIYPVFLSIFGTILLGLALLMTVNLLHSMNQLPLFGGVLGSIAELIGLVALVRFVTSNLLKQQKRAELLTRIAHLKKELLG
ncbi:CAAD domain-containing protein [Synechococcus sp. WH 8020]|uniref:CAAD domain-containing protein n=1 Tax=Synechococcus sp. (strain WH8020) TaxID=32052 RepID=UPI001FDEDB51|nr:CAAD domain-containing protein [Synechococcus sp. WH 8020]